MKIEKKIQQNKSIILNVIIADGGRDRIYMAYIYIYWIKPMVVCPFVRTEYKIIVRRGLLAWVDLFRELMNGTYEWWNAINREMDGFQGLGLNIHVHTGKIDRLVCEIIGLVLCFC